MKAKSKWVLENRSPLNLWLQACPTRFSGYNHIANEAGVVWTTVQKWAKKGCVPLSSVNSVAVATGIPPYMLNPELARTIPLIDKMRQQPNCGAIFS